MFGEIVFEGSLCGGPDFYWCCFVCELVDDPRVEVLELSGVEESLGLSDDY